MKKSTVIATCLVNSDMIRDVATAESVVLNVFQDEFPKHNFQKWNSNIPDKTAENIINSVGRASRINVKKFIEDLWEQNQYS